jgi:hypothetical protein
MKALRGVRVEKKKRTRASLVADIADIKASEEREGADRKANTEGVKSTKQRNGLGKDLADVANITTGGEEDGATDKDELNHASFTIEGRIPHGGNACEAEASDKEKKRARDPLKWYTALPPQSLRQTQTQFTTSLETIGSLASEQSALESLEALITDIRHQLAVQ